MNDILRQYYRGITQQLRAEVDFINSLFIHQGVKGEGNEAVLRDLLTKFIPKRYGIGTGVVIDRHGNQSRQSDIVVYDTLMYPSLLSLSSVHLFPVDVVYATIEVKTTLNSTSVKEALQNIRSVKNLEFIECEFADFESQGTAGVFGVRKTTPPIGFIFAYNSEVQHDETFKNWFIPATDRDTPKFPSVVCCLDMGLVSFKAPITDTEMGTITSVLPEAGMTPQCITFPIVKPKEDEPGQFQFLQIPNPPKNGELLHFDGAACPIKKVGEHYMAVDQSRVLLHFILMLNDLLTHKRINPNIKFADSYLRDIDKFHFVG